MASKSVLLFVLLALFAVIQIATSLKCYTCGKSDEGCNDPFADANKTSYETPCVDGQNACLKVLHPEDGDCWYRKCGKEADCNVYVDCHSCTGELCNASSNIMPSFIIIGTFSALLAKYCL